MRQTCYRRIDLFTFSVSSWDCSGRRVSSWLANLGLLDPTDFVSGNNRNKVEPYRFTCQYFLAISISHFSHFKVTTCVQAFKVVFVFLLGLGAHKSVTRRSYLHQLYQLCKLTTLHIWRTTFRGEGICDFCCSKLLYYI